MFIKFFYLRNIHLFFIYYLHQFFCVLFLRFFIISCLAVCFFLYLHCSCVFVLMFQIFFIYLLTVTIIIHQQVLLFFIFVLILSKVFESNNNTPSKSFWLLFSVSFLFLKVWLNKSGNLMLRLLFSFVYMLLFSHKHIKIPDHQEAISCSRYIFFVSDFIIQSLITQLSIDHYSISKFKMPKIKFVFSFIIIIIFRQYNFKSGSCSSKYTANVRMNRIFNKRDLHFIHLNINSLLSKVDELCYIAKSTNAVIIDICKSKLNAQCQIQRSVLTIIKFYVLTVIKL